MSDQPQTPPAKPVPPAPEAPVIPDRSDDDADVGWGERSDENEERLQRERPPHW